MKRYLGQITAFATATLRARAIALFILALGYGISLGAGLATGGPAGLLDAHEVAMSMLVFVLPLVVLHGVVQGDIRSGTALLWLQQPVSPAAHYASAWLGRTIVVCVLLAGLAALHGLLSTFLMPSGPIEIHRVLANQLLLTLVLSALVLAVSAWGIHPDSLFAAGLLVLSVYLLLRFPPASDEPLAAFVRSVVLPIDDLELVSRAFEGETTLAAQLGPVLRTIRWLAACLATALIGIWFTTRSPVPREGSG